LTNEKGSHFHQGRKAVTEKHEQIVSGAALDALIGLDDAYAAIQRMRDMLKDPNGYTAAAWYESTRFLNSECGEGWIRARAAMTMIWRNLPEYGETR
jgi:hypothetical protein